MWFSYGKRSILLLIASSLLMSTSALSSPPVDSLSLRPRTNKITSSLRYQNASLTVARGVSTQERASEEPISRRERLRRRGMAAALFSTYFTVMGAKCALPSVLSQLTSPKLGLSFAGLVSRPQTLMAQQLTLATFAIALGKILLGPLIDRFGGVMSLQACLATLMLMLGVIASANHFVTFALAWLVVDFVFSSCWAGCINAVHQSFPENEWAGRIGMIAAAARTGNASAFFLFAAVLQWSRTHLGPEAKSWRLVFGTSAALQVVPIFLLGYFDRMKTETEPVIESGSKSQESSPTTTIKLSVRTLRREAMTPEFWFHLVSRSANMVFGSFLLFVPTLMSQIYGLSASGAAQVGSVLAIGCLASVTSCSQLYSTLQKRGKIVLSCAFMGSAFLCALAQLSHMSGWLTLSPGMSTLSMFLWGFSFAVPFYIPSSMFALCRGGKESSATIADIFDIAGFGLLAVFNGYVASIRHNSLTAWIPTFQILCGCSLVSLISLNLAIKYE